jgi:hypothetical protein
VIACLLAVGSRVRQWTALRFVSGFMRRMFSMCSCFAFAAERSVSLVVRAFLLCFS